MFDESGVWDAPDLDSSLSAALLAKPTSTPPPKRSKYMGRYQGFFVARFLCLCMLGVFIAFCVRISVLNKRILISHFNVCDH